jgi:hypothetical protein
MKLKIFRIASHLTQGIKTKCIKRQNRRLQSSIEHSSEKTKRRWLLLLKAQLKFVVFERRSFPRANQMETYDRDKVNDVPAVGKQFIVIRYLPTVRA